MYHLGVVHIPMILMGIINKDYYLQLIRNKKTFQPLNPLRSYQQIVAKSIRTRFLSLKIP